MSFIYQKWLTSNKLTKKERQETQKLTPAERNVFFANESLHFGTAGVRGKMGLGTTRMNRFTYTNLAQAYARYIVDEYGINKTVIIGHDNRLHSTTFAKLVAKVLSAFKINAVLFPNNHLIPTPIVSYAIRVTKAVGGIIITASHNPKTYNGFKAYHNDGSQVLPNVVKKIDKKLIKPADILDITYQPQLGLISYLNKSIINRYFKDAQQVLIDNKKLQKKDKNFPVVLTAHHGTACKLLPKFLHTLGFNIKPVTAQMFYSPTFVNSPISNPEDINSFALAIKLAEKIGSLICIGVDPDADRMAICIKHQNKWRLISGNEMGIIYTYYVLKKRKFIKKPYVVSSYVSTNLIDCIIKKYGGKVYRTGTGFKWMGAKITEIGNKESFVVAFEEAIGALNTTINRDKDSFTASALALEIYAVYQKQGMDFIDVLEKEIYPQYGQWFGKTVAYNYDMLNWKPVIEQKMQMLKKYKNKTIGDLTITSKYWNLKGDCLEWHLINGGWIKFRMSGTEPKFKIYYNLFGDTQSSLTNQYNKLNTIFQKMLMEK